MFSEVLHTTCCIAGGGPSGIMLGYLLARAGVDVTVLEKHKDFNRDFRGDTVHPSTLEVLYELGLLDDFLKLPHQEVESVGGRFGDFSFTGADVRHLPTRCRFVALMPQWDFLNFLSDRAKEFPTFHLRMRHKAVDLIREGSRFAGVEARVPGCDPVQVRAHLVVGCDGRHSAIREAAQLHVIESGVPIDVLWFRIRRQPGDPRQVLGTVDFGKGLIMIDRADYFQAGLIVPKGAYPEIQGRGIEAFRASVLQLAPYLSGREDEIRDWDQVKVLTVQINRLRRWYREGVLCIGDAAHAMSPAGGVGINLAIQDAVATANLLAGPLANAGSRPLTESDLSAVQRRREFPARLTQRVQVFVHRGFSMAFQNPGSLRAPWQMKVVLRIPGIQRALGYAVGIGVRPEHVQGAAVPPCPKLQSFARAIGTALGSATLFTRRVVHSF